MASTSPAQACADLYMERLHSQDKEGSLWSLHCDSSLPLIENRDRDCHVIFFKSKRSSIFQHSTVSEHQLKFGEPAAS